MSHFSLAPMRPLSILVALVISGCTLDFDEFTPYTEENLRNRRNQPEADMAPDPPNEMDMVAPEDMRPPPNDVDPPLMGDGDEDGVLDEVDNCPEVPNTDQQDSDENGVGDACDDADQDGVLDYRYDPEAPEPYTAQDNCLGVSNPDQLDLDWDQEGDACDLDVDGDGLSLEQEQELGTDPRKSDSDDDGYRDDVDYCPLSPSRDNRDLDEDGYGDDCDADDDGDGVYDWLDNCPFAPNPDQSPTEPRGADCATDADSDELADDVDPCPYEPNVEGVSAACALGVRSWGYDGDHYDLEWTGDGELFSATRGGLRLLYPLPEGPSLWGEEAGLPSRYLKRVEAVTHPRVSAWLMMDVEQSLSVLRWDSVLSNYYLTEVPLAALGVSGAPQAISAYEGYAWLGTSEGLYQLDQNGGTAVTLQAASPSVTALYTTSDNLTIIAAGTELFTRSAEGQVSSLGTLIDHGDVRAIRPLNDEQFALLGSDKTALISRPTPGQPLEILSSYDYAGYDILERPDGLYLATAEGVRYIDSYGRSYAPNTRQVGGTVARSLERSAQEGRFWAATSGSASELYALWNGYSIPDEPCVRDHWLDGSYWWAATPTGLFRVSASGDKQSYGGGSFYVIEPGEQDLWSANETILVRVTPDETLQYQLPPALVTPVKAIKLVGQRLWIGGLNSAAYTDLVDGAPSEWTVLEANGTELPRGQVVGIEMVGDILYMSVKGDQNIPDEDGIVEGGLARYDMNIGAFVVPSTVTNGGIASHNIYDLDAYANILAVASNLGARVMRSIDQALSFSNISLNAGLPNEVGNTNVLSLDVTPRYLFMSIRPTVNLQDYGSLVRFTHNQEEPNPINFNTAQFYSSADTDILTVPDADLSSTRLHDLSSPSGSPQMSYSSCGSEAYPGLVGLLDGEASLRQRLEERRLKVPANGPEELNVLIPSPSVHPTWAQSYGPAEEAKVYLTDLADEYPEVYMAGDPRPRRSPPVTRAIQLCQRFLDNQVECLLAGNYIATNINGNWNVPPNVLFDGTPTQVKDFVIDEDKPGVVRWYATSRGLIQRRSPTVFNDGFTIPGEDGAPITNLYAVHQSSRHGLLFVGSDQGLNFSPALQGEVTQELWTPITELRGVKVYDLAEDPTGALWVASAQGLFKANFTEGQLGEVTHYGVRDGLPAGVISHVAVSSEGHIFALHSSGLSKYYEGSWSHYGPRVGASRGATSLLVTGGYVWVGGPQGVTRFSY